MSIWFVKVGPDGAETALTRFEAIDLLGEVSRLIDKGRVGAAMEKIGMDPSVHAEQQTLEELAQVFQVRLADLARYAGVKL